MTIPNSTPIWEEEDCCEKCGTTEGVGVMYWLRTAARIRLCEPCHDDKEALRVWLQQEMETAIRESGEYEQLPDGNWRKIKSASTGKEANV